MGSRLGGRYRLVERIGEGGMGVVFRATDELLEADVALKVLNQQLLGDAEMVARFKRELLTARKISHENVVRIHDIGEDRGLAFISMELLTETLADWSEDHSGHAYVDEALRIAEEILKGLSAVHAAGVLHRDIKPHNILLDAARTVKLADFGMARDAGGPVLPSGTFGTPFYMAPEQFFGQHVSRATDVYSLGVLLYELFSGRLPFEGKRWPEIAHQHSVEEPAPLDGLAPWLPRGVAIVVHRALEKEPLARYASAEAMRDAFRRALESEEADYEPMTVSRAPVAPGGAVRRFLDWLRERVLGTR